MLSQAQALLNPRLGGPSLPQPPTPSSSPAQKSSQILYLRDSIPPTDALLRAEARPWLVPGLNGGFFSLTPPAPRLVG